MRPVENVDSKHLRKLKQNMKRGDYQTILLKYFEMIWTVVFSPNTIKMKASTSLGRQAPLKVFLTIKRLCYAVTVAGLVT